LGDYFIALGISNLVSGREKPAFTDESSTVNRVDSQSFPGFSAKSHVSTAFAPLFKERSFWKGYFEKFLTLP
jgi:hypothetical protein